MSQYGTIYRAEWNMMAVGDGVTTGDRVRIDISPTDYLIDDADDPEVIEMIAGANPLKISVIDNDNDKFTTIRAKQAVMEIVTGNGIDISTFAVGSDNLWIVTIYFDPDGVNTILFKGYLVLSDLQQSYLPDPVTIVLTASDHLGLLKDINLVDFSDEVPSGKYKIGQLIAMCLRKTGLDLNIRVINNLRHGSGEVTVTTTDVGFTAPDNIILISAEFAYFFYQGQTFTVTGTASNDGTYTVVAVAQTAIIGLFFVLVAEDLTAENVTNVTFTDTSSATHIYAGTYLDAKTFETTIGECEDCYSVLTKILGEDCFLTQYKGEWWIVRIDEIENLPVYVALFDSTGVYQSIATQDYSKEIGSAETHRFANADQLLFLDRPHGFVKETFKFTYPAETICNIDYSRGDETSDTDVQVTGYTSYDLDCWEAKRLWGSGAQAAQIKAAILRSFNTLGDEEQRFIMLTQPTTNEDAYNYILSSPVPMTALDKFKFSFDVSAMTNPSGDGMITVCYILLYGIDGSIYTLDILDTAATWINTDGEVDTIWRETNEAYTLFRSGLQWAMYDGEDKTVWQPCTILSAPLPVAGDVRFMLCSADQSANAFDSFNVRYQNISLEYMPYIGGSYRKYAGFYHKIDRGDSDYIAKREREVYIADAPKPLFKGAMFIVQGSSYALTTRWYTANTFALGYPTSTEYLHPYGHIQAYAVWNQYRLVVRRINGSILGFGSDWPDIIHKYSLTDSNPNVDNRFFLMLSFEQDWKTGIMSATIIEVYKTDDGHVYADDHEFKYITE